RSDAPPAPTLRRCESGAHHNGRLTIILARRRGDHRMRLWHGATDALDEAPHTRIARREAVRVHQVLPDGHGVAPTLERSLDQLSMRLARARRGGPGGGRWTPPPWGRVLAHPSGWTPRRNLPFLTRRCRWTPPAWWPVLGATPAGVRPGRARERRPLS